jgi:nitroreductase
MSGTIRRRELLQALAVIASGSTSSVAADCKDLEWLLGHRRMVRRFRSEPVHDDVIRDVIDAATRAPSAGHLQPWAFVVVRDSRTRRRLGEAAAGQVWLADAPVSVVACAEPSRGRARYGERADRYALIDTAFASMLLLLAVTERGLGACFVGALDDARVRALLQLPADLQPVAVIPIGHPAEVPRALTRRPPASVVHSERWSK